MGLFFCLTSFGILLYPTGAFGSLVQANCASYLFEKDVFAQAGIHWRLHKNVRPAPATSPAHLVQANG